MTTPLRLACPALATVAIAFAGCGGGDGGGGETLSKADFQTKANAICKQVNSDIDKLGAPSNFAEIPAFTDKAVAITDDALDKLKDLNPPKEFQDDWNQWLDYGAQLHDTADELKDAAKNKDEKALQAAGVKADARDKKSDAIAVKLGLQTCAQG